MNFADCCTRYIAQGESVCPVCQSQAHEAGVEREQARAFRASMSDLRPAARVLAERHAYTPAELGLSVPANRRLLRNNPSRRTVFRLLGFYLPETEARELLSTIRDYMWIEAEKAGCDIWRRQEPRAPLEKAAKVWASRYLPVFLEAHEREAA